MVQTRKSEKYICRANASIFQPSETNSSSLWGKVCYTYSVMLSDLCYKGMELGKKRIGIFKKGRMYVQIVS